MWKQKESWEWIELKWIDAGGLDQVQSVEFLSETRNVTSFCCYFSLRSIFYFILFQFNSAPWNVMVLTFFEDCPIVQSVLRKLTTVAFSFSLQLCNTWHGQGKGLILLFLFFISISFIGKAVLVLLSRWNFVLVLLRGGCSTLLHQTEVFFSFFFLNLVCFTFTRWFYLSRGSSFHAVIKCSVNLCSGRRRFSLKCALFGAWQSVFIRAFEAFFEEGFPDWEEKSKKWTFV